MCIRDRSSNVATPTLDPMAGTPGKSTRDDALYQNKDISGNTVSFESDNGDGDANTYIELVDHILETFPIGKKEKIFGDLIGGFGDGPQGRLVYRPSKYKHEGFVDGAATGLVTHFLLKLEPVRGSRFGLMNTNELKKKYTFSYRSFGQFSDLLEQPLDSRFNRDPDDPTTGAIIRMESRNANNPSVPMPMSQNTRRNVDIYQRISFPFFDNAGPAEFIPTLSDVEPTTSLGNVNTLPGPDMGTGSGISINPEDGNEHDASGNIQPAPRPNPGTRVNVAGSLQSSKVIRPGQQGASLSRKKT